MLYQILQQYCDGVRKNESSIGPQRKELLNQIIASLLKKRANQEPLNLIFICTHNSRRSILGQVWAKTISTYYQIEVGAFSGGTEVTAVNENVINILRKVGFKIEKSNESKNPIFSIWYSERNQPMVCYSKIYSNENNPQDHFLALLTCADAEQACPHIQGAIERIAIPYDDPKIYDPTPQCEAEYEKRSMQIATEMSYIFRILHHKK